jgi:hypothetical protein
MTRENATAMTPAATAGPEPLLKLGARPGHLPAGDGAAERLEDRLDRIEARLEELIRLVGRDAPKEWYSTAEVGAILGRDAYTVREWARLGRINAEKRPSGRSKAREWVVSHAELERIKNRGLLPMARPAPATA